MPQGSELFGVAFEAFELGHFCISRYVDTQGQEAAKAPPSRRARPRAPCRAEGMIWLSFRNESPLPNATLTFAYSLFSHVLWPIFIPFTSMLFRSCCSI